MSSANFPGKPERFLSQAFNALSRWQRRKPATCPILKSRPVQLGLDALESRLVPASILNGNQIVLGIGDNGSFVTTNSKNALVGLQFGGTDILSPGTPLGGFSVSVNNQSYFNYYYETALNGTLTDISTAQTKAVRFVSTAIPGLTITREISMPLDSRQILVSMTFENTTKAGAQAKTFTNLASMEIDDPDPNGFDTFNDVVNLGTGLLARANSSTGLTFALFSSSATASAAIVGSESGFGFTDSDPLRVLPAPRGTLPAGVGDPNGKQQDVPLRLADSISTLAPGQSATIFSTILVGTTTAQVNADANLLAHSAAPTADFAAIGSTNAPLSSASIAFSSPIFGLRLQDFTLTFNGAAVPLSGVTLVSTDGGKGQQFRLDGLASLTSAEGNYRLTLNSGGKVSDMAGRFLASPAALAWRLDATPPAAPLFTAFSPNTGGTSDLATNAAQVIVSGLAESGARVDISHSISGAGLGAILASTTADAAGNWTVTIATNVFAEGTVQLFSRATDTNGNVGPLSSPLSFRFDQTSPGVPTLTTFAEDTGISSTDKITREKRPTLGGTAEAGSLVEIQLDGAGVVGTVRAGEGGNWSFSWPASLANLDDGAHRLIFTSIDTAGNRSGSKTIDIVIDSVAPTGSALDPVIAGLITNSDGRLLSNGQSVVMSGTGEPGATIALRFDAKILGIANIGANGRWFIPVAFSGIADGQYTIHLVASDTAGNISDLTGANIVVDTTAPAAPRIRRSTTQNGVTIATGGVTNDPVLLLSGNAEPNALVEITQSGAGVLGTVRADIDGLWSFAPAGTSASADGAYRFTARAIDRVGNASLASLPFDIQVDTTAPLAPSIQGVLPDTGVEGDGITAGPDAALFGTAEPGSTIQFELIGTGEMGSALADADGRWIFPLSGEAVNDGFHEIVGRAIDLAGNMGAPSASFKLIIDATDPVPPSILGVSGDDEENGITGDLTPDFHGNAEPYSLVEISMDGLGVIGQTRARENGDWSLSWQAPDFPLIDGLYQVRATASDSAGNRSLASNPFSFLIDTQPPPAPAILGILNDTGVLGDGITSAAHPILFGTSEPGATVRIAVSGAGIQGTTLADDAGRWQIELNGSLADGVYSIVASATDNAGNTGLPGEPFRLVLDAIAPDKPIIIGLEGDANEDRIVNDNTPAFEGLTEPFAAVEVSMTGLGVMGHVQADEDGFWRLTWTAASPLTDGFYRVSATASDIAGNRSLPSNDFLFQIDTKAPSAPLILKLDPDTGDDSDDRITSATNPVLTGTGEAGATIVLRLVDTGATMTTRVTGDGTWRSDLASLGPFTDGTWTVTATLVDRAGNTSPVSSPFAFAIDTEAAPIPLFLGFLDDSGRSDSDQVTNSPNPGLTGNAEPGSTVLVSRDGVEVGRVIVGEDGSWSLLEEAPSLEEGIHFFRLRSEDFAGNLSNWSEPIAVTIDRTAPDSATKLAVSPITGRIGELPLVNRQNVSLSGVAEGDSTIEVMLDGQAFMDLVTEGQNWTIPLGESLGEGVHNVSVRVIDRAGNASDWSDYAFAIDVTPPAAPSIGKLTPDTGASPSDALTQANLVSFSGLAEPFSLVNFDLDGLSVGTVFARADGSWDFSLGGAVTDGAHLLRASATDRAGNVSVQRGEFGFVVDTAAPAPGIIQAISGDRGLFGAHLVNTRALTLQGAVEPNAVVDVYAGVNLLGTVQASPQGRWTLALPESTQSFLNEGTNSLRVRATDAAENTSGFSAGIDLTLDTQKPDQPMLTGIEADTGIPADKKTSDPRPLLVGKAEPYSIVLVYDSEALLGSESVDGEGNWRLLPSSDLPQGIHAIRMRAVDAAGNFGDFSDPVLVEINYQAPAAPLLLGFTPDSGITGDWTTSASQITLQGTSGPGTFLDILVHGNVVGHTRANDEGVWSFALPGYLAEGTYAIQAIATSITGVVGEPSAVAILRVDATPPLAPVIDGISPDTGSSSHDFVTGASHLVLNGHGEAGAKIEVRLDALLVGSVVADSTGKWQIDLGDNLPGRLYRLSTRATDAAGNASDWSAPTDLQVDTQAPVAPVILRIDPDSGRAGDDRITSATLPVISGTAEPGSMVTLRQIESGWVVQVLAGADGIWSADFSAHGPLADGGWTFRATATDLAGNTSELSLPLSIQIDTSAPAVPALTGLLQDSGRDATDRVTNNNLPGLQGLAEPGSIVVVELDGAEVDWTVADASGRWSVDLASHALAEGVHAFRLRGVDVAGNESNWSASLPITTDYTNPANALGIAIDPITGMDGLLPLVNRHSVSVGGTAEADATIEVMLDGAVVGSLVAATGNWSLSLGDSLTEGNHVASVRVVDRAGNASGWTTYSFAVDVTLPAAPAIRSISPDTGSNSSDFLTAANQIAIAGLAEPNSTLNIILDGNAVGSVVTDAKGAWEFAIPQKLSHASHRVQVFATDLAGNTSATAGELNFVVDLAAPNSPSIDSVSPDSGVEGDRIVNSRAVSLLGKAEANAAVELFLGTYSLGKVQADAQGQWTMKVSAANRVLFNEGSNLITAKATDAAGNVSAASLNFDLKLDTRKPDQPSLSGIEADTGIPGDLLTSDQRPLLKGLAEPNSLVQVYLSDSLLGIAAADSLGNWQFQPQTNLPLGNNPIRLRAIDVAGNFGDFSAPVMVQIDISVPPVPVLVGFSPNSGLVSDWITSATDVTLQGTGKPDSFVDLVVNGNVVGRVRTNTVGSWSFAIPSHLAEGTYEIQARSISLAGVESALSAITELTVDTTAPLVPVIAAVAPDTGASNGDFITSTASPILQGHAEPGSLVEIKVDAQVAGKVTADASGNWQISLGENLPNRVYKISVRTCDAAGNASAWSESTDLLIDTVAPLPQITGLPSNSLFNESTWPGLLQGTVSKQNGESAVMAVWVTLQDRETGLWFDGTQFTSATPVKLAAQYVAGTEGDGRWSLDLPAAMIRGAKAYRAAVYAEDQAGNVTAKPGPVDFTIDRVAPVGTIDPRNSAVSVNFAPIVYSLRFSEPVVGLDAADFVLQQGATILSITGSGANWTVTMQPGVLGGPAAGMLVGQGLTDLAGNHPADVTFAYRADVANTRDAALPITLNAQGQYAYDGSFDADNATDWFMLPIPDAGKAIELTLGGAGSPILAGWYDASGKLLASTLASPGSQGVLRLQPSADARYLRIEHGNFGETGPLPPAASTQPTRYALSLRVIAPISDPQGGNQATAEPLTFIENQLQTSGDKISFLDTEYVKFTAPATGYLDAAVVADLGSRLNATLVAYDSRGRVLTIQAPGTLGESGAIRLPVIAGREYSLRVDGLADGNGLGGTGKWVLSCQFRASTDATGPANSMGDPLRLSATGRATISGAVDFAGDTDLAQINADAAGNYLVRMNPRVTSPDLIPKIIVLDQNFQMVQEITGTAGTALTSNVRLGAPGTYYLLFAGAKSSKGAFDGIIQTDDLGVTSTTAGGFVADGNEQKATGTINLDGDQDLFSFTAPAASFYQIVLQSADGSTGQFAYAAASGALPTASASGSVGKVFVEAGQTIYVRVEGIDGATGRYQLALKAAGDDFTDLLDSAKAGTIVVGVQSTTGALETFGDRDVFTWTAPTDPSLLPPFGAFSVSALSDPAHPVDTYLTIYRVKGDGSTEIVASVNDSVSGSDAMVFFQASAGTTYLFEVRGADDNEIGPYRIALKEDRLEAGDDSPASFQLANLDKTFQLDQAKDLKIAGTIGSAADLDIFRFTPAQSGSWILKADAQQGAGLDPYLTIYDANYAKLASDDDSGAGSGALILTNLVAGKSYYIAVSSSAGRGAYTLQAQLSPSGTSGVADDYSADRPGVIAPPVSGQTNVSGKIEFSGDSDTFTLDWPANAGSATLRVRLEATSGSALNPYLTILDDAGKVQFSSDNTGSSLSSTILFDVDPGQKWYLRASSADKTLGGYTLSIEGITQPASDDHPGSPTQDPTKIVLSDTSASVNATIPIYSGSIGGKIEQLGDRDFVKVIAPIAGMLTVSDVRAKDSFVNPYLRAYSLDAAGGLVQLAADDDSLGGLDAKLQVRVKEGQEIYLLATGAAGTTGAYTIDVALRQDDIGGLPSTAQELRLNGLAAEATGRIELASDTDMYAYKPNKSGSITVRLSGSGGLNPYLFVNLGSDGSLVASNNDLSASNQDSQIQMQVVAGETYYFSVRCAANTSGDYALNITPVVDDYPSSAALARLLPLGAGNAGEIGGKIEAEGDTDWFRIVPTEGGILRIRLDGVGNDGVDATLAVYNDAGQLLGQSDDSIVNGAKSSGSEISLTVRAGRSYFIRAAGYGESTGAYQLKLETGQAVSDDFGNTLDTADLVDLDGDNQAGFNGALDGADQDVVRFIAPATGDFVVTYSGQAGQLRALVRDDSGTLQVASGDFSAKDKTFKFHVSLGQEIFLLAAAPDDTKLSGGDFKVKVQLIAGTESSANAVSSDLINTLNTTLTQSFTQLIGQGVGDADFYKIRDQITQALIESLKAASGGQLTTSYLVIWLDPADFVMTDSASQQIGSKASQGAINENSSAALSQKGALDLVIIPSAQASNYSMQLFGVGGGRVLAGATMIQADGTVVTPKVSINGASSDNGIPVGSVPKEGLTLSLDFRGEQTVTTITPTPATVAAIGSAAQQIVQTLLSGLGTGASGISDAALASADLAVLDLLTLFVGANGDFDAYQSDGRLYDTASFNNKETVQFLSLVRRFAVDIHQSISKTIDRLGRDSAAPAGEVLGLLKHSLSKLGLDHANSALEHVGAEGQKFLGSVLKGPLNNDSVTKGVKRFWSGLLKELETGKVSKGLTPAMRESVLAVVKEQVARGDAKELPALEEASLDLKALLSSTIDTKRIEWLMGNSMAPFVSTTNDSLEGKILADQVWLEAFNETGEIAFQQEPKMEGHNTTDVLFGLAVAALVAPSWLQTVPASRDKKSKAMPRIPVSGERKGR